MKSFFYIQRISPDIHYVNYLSDIFTIITVLKRYKNAPALSPGHLTKPD